jgi:hypothetical protein
LLEERIKEIERILEVGLPGIKDKAKLARDMAQQGMGATATLIQLGAVKGGWNLWTKRFLDAARIPHEPWSGSISFSLDVDDEPGEDSPEDDH